VGFLELQYGTANGFSVVFPGFFGCGFAKRGVLTIPVPLELTPQEVQSRVLVADRLVWIDVREPEEFAITRIEGAQLLPMQSVPAEIQRLKSFSQEASLVIFCHHGVRSLQVVSWLRQQGVDNCISLAGGIDQWSREIDATVPRY
jgi:rhodanese-related sulfurtransferase